MSAPTKQKALAKLAAFKILVGYPDTWIDYSTLDVVRGDAFGNMRRAEAFNRARNLARLKEPVDPIDWPINPQAPRAVIMFSPNAEFFSAAILQPPLFNVDADNAVNYGSIGAVAPLRNQGGFYEAFGVKEGDKMYLAPEQRVIIW